MYRVKVKICGIRTLEEATAALEYGADALGFNFWPGSPRHVSLESAAAIISRLNPFATCIGVVVNETPDVILSIFHRLGLSAVQLHGDETPEYCKSLADARIIKALRVGPAFDPKSIKAYPANAILLDASMKGHYGGTGRRFDWSAAIESKEYAPIILAGGLTIENVEDAIKTVRPMAVDVCSGVEAEPGKKDFGKLKLFMETVHRVTAA
jgi:phosphoribosylanthranilate isomerase